MVHPAFIYVLLLLAGITVQLACAQNLAVQSAPLPVIQGKINGMDVVAQGDSVAFFAGQLPGGYSDDPCAEDLHCSLHKNNTPAVQISPEGIRLLQLNPDHLKNDEDEEDASSRSVLPSMTLNTLDSSSSYSFKELFIPAEEIEPTPTLATLYTGNPVVDQTPGLAWINSETMRLLATTVETVDFLSTSTSGADDDFTLVNPSPTESVKVLMTITGELDELRRRLMSSATLPVPTPVQTDNDDPELESDEIILETHTDILIIRPSPSEKYGKSSGGTNPFTFSVKQVPTVTEGSPSESNESASATSDSTPVESSQASSLQSSEEQSVESEINGAPEPGLMQWVVSVMGGIKARIMNTIFPNPVRQLEEEGYLLPMPEGTTAEMFQRLDAETLKLIQKLEENDVSCFVCRSTFRDVVDLIRDFHCQLIDIVELHTGLLGISDTDLEACQRVYTEACFTKKDQRESVERFINIIRGNNGAIRKHIDNIRAISQKLESIKCSNQDISCQMIFEQTEKSWLVVINQQINELDSFWKEIDDFTESFRSEIDQSQGSSKVSLAIFSDYRKKLQKLGNGVLQSRYFYFDFVRKKLSGRF